MDYQFSVPALPREELSPNSRFHRYAKWTATAADISDVIGAFLQTYPRPERLLERATLDIHVIQRFKRKADLDNMTARCKGFIDGLKGLVLLDDSAAVVGSLTVRISADKALGPATIITISEVGG